MTFGEIKTDVFNLLIDTPASVQSLVPTFINNAHRKLQEKHNFKIMEANLPLSTTLLTRELGPVPTDWKESRVKPFWIGYYGDFHELVFTSNQSEALASYGNRPDFDYGAPRILHENNESGQFEVYPFPDGLSLYADGEYPITIPYWRFFPSLDDDSSEDWFTQNAAAFITYRATAFGFYANEDENRGKHWDAMATREWNDVLLTDKRRRMASTDTLVFHIGARSPHTQE